MLNINECERINLKKGDILTKAADKADKVYLIVNGKDPYETAISEWNLRMVRL